MKPIYTSGLPQTLGGLCALAVVMGIGRFAYTALLPGMMQTHAFDEGVAGAMAAWNYAGYLAGVLAMRNQTHGRRRYGLFALFLALSLASTAGMGLVQAVWIWHAMRFLAGVASGACFVLCSSIVLDTLAALGRPVLAGILYSGVGCGIALGGLGARLLEPLAGVDGAWIWMALFCIPPVSAALAFLRPGVNTAPPIPEKGACVGPVCKPGKGYGILLAAYFLEGFGYIIGTTFLVALVQASTNSPGLASASWIITGCAAAVSAPLWRVAARKGYLPMLILAFALQASGVLLPVLSTAVVSVVAGALLLGGTFMGITVLSLQYGVVLSGRPSAHTVAMMTALYGAGQIIGPFVAGQSARGQGFGFAFVLSSVALFLAVVLLAACRPRAK
jgi:MFS family permease